MNGPGSAGRKAAICCRESRGRTTLELACSTKPSPPPGGAGGGEGGGGAGVVGCFSLYSGDCRISCRISSIEVPRSSRQYAQLTKACGSLNTLRPNSD